jgi:flagellar basal-body rod modification protein FlgD
MSTVNNVNSNSSANAAGAAASLGATSAQGLQNEFLTLLVTQMQNQDPLNPMDSSQMTSQLAQISTVQGIQDLNTSIQSLLTQINALQSVDSANLIGRDALVPGTSITLGANGAAGGYELANAVDGGTINIQDANGNTVQTIPLPNTSAGVSTFTWDGSTASGGTAAPGNYSFTINATAGGNPASGVTTLSAGQIIGTDVNSSGATMLNMGPLGDQSVSSIVQLM